MSAMTELMFQLDVEDDWPPVAKECLVGTAAKSGYRIAVPPLFVKDLSVGDVIAIERDSEGDVAAWSHIERSNHSTVWIMVHGENSIEDAIECLKKLKCNIERFEEYRYFAIDVPEECTLEQLDGCLGKIDEEKASIAYPSFRH